MASRRSWSARKILLRPSLPTTPSVTVNEGQTATNTGTYSDPSRDNVTMTASVGTVTKTGTNTAAPGAGRSARPTDRTRARQ